MSKVAIVAKLVAQEGKRDELLAVFSGNMPNIEAETGTLVYAMHSDLSDDVTVWFYELYADSDAVAAHGSSDAMKALGPKLAPLLAGRPEVKRLSPVNAKGL